MISVVDPSGLLAAIRPRSLTNNGPFLYTPAEYNNQNAFRNLVCNANRSDCLSIRFGNAMLHESENKSQGILVFVFS